MDKGENGPKQKHHETHEKAGGQKAQEAKGSLKDGGEAQGKKTVGEAGQAEELRNLNEEYKETLQRLQAEFENYRKRAEKEGSEFLKLANAKLIENFLPIVDSMETAIKQAEKAGNAEMKAGFASVLKQFMQTLEKNGVRRIESTGKKFDHALHEVLMAGKEEGKADEEVLEEFQKGYTLHGKMLRPAKVKVNKRDEKIGN